MFLAQLRNVHQPRPEATGVDLPKTVADDDAPPHGAFLIQPSLECRQVKGQFVLRTRREGVYDPWSASESYERCGFEDGEMRMKSEDDYPRRG
jgi:hypothetical protein